MTGERTIIMALQRWRDRTIRGAALGAALGAQGTEDAARATTAYVGMSGATRASTVAYVATHDDPNTAAAQAAYQDAARLLTGFTGHNGQPLLADVPGPGEDRVWVVLTVPTDYALKLEQENGGEKAFLADTMQQTAPDIAQFIAQAIRGGQARG